MSLLNVRPGLNSYRPYDWIITNGDPAVTREFYSAMITPVNGVIPLDLILLSRNERLSQPATMEVADWVFTRQMRTSLPADLIAMSTTNPVLKQALYRLSPAAQEQFGIELPPGVPTYVYGPNVPAPPVPPTLVTTPLVVRGPTLVRPPPPLATPPPANAAAAANLLPYIEQQVRTIGLDKYGYQYRTVEAFMAQQRAEVQRAPPAVLELLTALLGLDYARNIVVSNVSTPTVMVPVVAAYLSNGRVVMVSQQ